MEYLKKALFFLKEPEKAFKKEVKTKFGESFKYLLVLSVILAVLSGLLGFANPLGPAGVLGLIVAMYLVIVFGTLLRGLVLHLFAYLFGARKGLEQTLKVSVYSETPTLLLGWIPVINVAALIWSLILNIIGLRSLQKMTTGQAVGAVLLPIIIVLVIAVIIASIFIAALLPYMLTGGLTDFAGAGALHLN